MSIVNGPISECTVTLVVPAITMLPVTVQGERQQARKLLQTQNNGECMVRTYIDLRADTLWNKGCASNFTLLAAIYLLTIICQEVKLNLDRNSKLSQETGNSEMYDYEGNPKGRSARATICYGGEPKYDVGK